MFLFVSFLFVRSRLARLMHVQQLSNLHQSVNPFVLNLFLT